MRKSHFLILFILSLGLQNLIAQCTVTITPNSPVSICRGDSVMLTASGANTYTWNNVGSLSSGTGATVMASPNNTTNYTVTGNCGGGNTDQATIQVIVHPKPIASFVFAPNNVCSGTATNFTSNVVNGTPPYTYAWTFGGGGTSTNTNPTHTFTSLGCGTANLTNTLIVTDANGCSDTVSNPISVIQAPDVQLADANVLSPFSNCLNNPTQSNPNDTIVVNDISPSAGCITTYNINWGDGNFNNGLTGASFPLQHIYTALGAFNIVVTAVGTNGCTGTATYLVANQSNPAGGLSTLGSTSGCGPITLPFLINNWQLNSPGTTYNLDFGDGNFILLTHPLNAGLTQDTVYHTYTTSSCPGSNFFTATLTVTNACSNTAYTASNIQIRTRPVASFTATPTQACVGVPVCFTNTSVAGYGPNCSTGTIYAWNFGDPASGALNTSALANPPCHTYATAGNYTITLSTSNGCGATNASVQICVTPTPTPGFTLDNITGCAPLNVNATNTSNTLNNCAPATYLWTITYTASPPCAVTSAFNFTGGTTATSTNPSFSFINAGTYTITLSVTNPCGTFTISQNVVVNGPPIVTVTAVPNSCGAATVSPTAVVTNCGLNPPTYAWTFGGGVPNNSAIAVPPAISFAANGNHTITLSVSNECGATPANTAFSVFPQPVANAGPNVSVCAGVATNLAGSAAGGTPAYSYSWISNPAGFVSALQNPAVSPFVNTTYSLTVTDANLCSSIAQMDVTVNPLPVVDVNSPSICVGATATLTAAGANTYVWSNASILNPINVTPAVTTNYTVTGTTTATGCTNIATSTVTVNPLPVVNAGPSITLCNQPIPYNLAGFSPAGGTWSGAGVTAGGVFTPSIAGNFTLTYSYTDAVTTCSNTDTMIVTVVAPQPANAGTGFNLCSNAAIVALTGFTPVGGVWTGTGIVGNSFDPATAGAGAFILTYTFGVGTCASTDTIMVTVNPQPNVTVNSPNICAGATATLTANGATTYLWSNASVLNPINVTPAATVNFTVTGTVTATGCTNTATSTVTVNPLPVVNAGPNINVCNQPIATNLAGFSPAGGVWSGAGVTAGGVFTPTVVGNVTLTYTYTDPITSCSSSATMVVTVVNPQTANAGTGFNVCSNVAIVNLVGFTPAGGTWTGTGIVGNTFNPATAGAGAFILTYSFGVGTCLSTDTIMVNVNAQPNVTVNSPTICAGATATLTANGATTYLWSNASVLNPINVTPAVTTNYTVTGTVTATGCSNVATSTVTVNPLPVVNAGVGNTYCNQPATITLAGYNPIGGVWSGVGIVNGALGTFDPSIPPVGNNILTYTFTDVNGCTNSATITNTINPPVVVNAGPDDVICINNGLFNLTGWAPITATWSGTGIINPTGVFDPSVSGVGVFTLTLTNIAGACIGTDTKTITVQALPVVNAGANETTCISTPAYNLNGFSPAGGNWTGTGITNGALGTFNPATSGVGTFTLTYTYTDPITNCTNSATKTITIGALPVVAFTNNPTDCINSSVAFTNNTTGATSYSWDFGDGGTSIATAPSYTYLTAGNYTIQLTALSALGCSDSITNTIQINDIPVPSFTTLPNVGCGPLNVTFTNTSTGVITSYAWTFGNGNSSALTIPPVQTYQQGIYDSTYFVSLTTTNNCGVATYNDSVLVQSPPIVDFGTQLSSACSPFLVLMNNTSTGSPSNFTWDFGDGTTSNLANPGTHPYLAAQNDSTYFITLIGTNACGTDTMVRPLLILHNNVVAFFNTSPANGCAPHTVNFTDFSTGATFISWDFGDGITSTATNPSHIYTNPGTYTAYQFADNGCNYDTTSILITIYVPPIISFTTSTNVTCANTAINFVNTSIGAQGYTWNFGDGGTSQLNNPTHTYTAGGVYTISLVGTSGSNGCLDSITQTITINGLPFPNISSNVAFGCLALNVNFGNTTTNAIFYTWDFGDGNTSTLMTPSHTYMNTGFYTVNMVAENLNGCKDSIQLQINVYPNPVANFTLPAPYGCSLPSIVNFTNTSTGAAGYIWNFGNGATSVLVNPAETYTANTPYTITLIATNTFNCADTATNNYTVYQPPQTSFAPDIISGCQPVEVAFTNQTINGTSFIWNLGDNTTATSTGVIHDYPNPGIYTVTLIASNSTPCADTSVMNNLITVYPTPTASFALSPNETSIITSEITFIDQSTGGDTCQVYWGDGSIGNCYSIHTYLTPGTYTVMQVVTNNDGCTDTAYHNVIINPAFTFYIPNAFTPNSNGTNDEFFAQGTGIKDFQMEIYDRWGMNIFISHDINDHWDGKLHGNVVQQDVYVYKVILRDVFGDEHKYRGTVTVVK